MKIHIGDRVKYLNDVGGGVVRKILDASTVEIEDNDGFNVPILMSELVKVESGEESSMSLGAIDESKNRASQKKKKPYRQIPVANDNRDDDDEDFDFDAYEFKSNKKSKMVFEPEVVAEEIEGNDVPRLFFALVPENHDLSSFDLYLINDCNFSFLFNYSNKKLGKYSSVDNSSLEPNTKMHLCTISREDLTTIQSYVFQGVFYKTKDYEIQRPVCEEININPIKFFKQGSYVENDYFDNDALILPVLNPSLEELAEILTPENASDIIRQKESERRPRIASKKENKEERNAIREVDLHIHELVESELGLTPGDKLNIQIKEFERQLNQAVQDRIKRIVFIHGVGNGVLKMKIRSILDHDYKKFKYQDASFQKYKYGATIVFL